MKTLLVATDFSVPAENAARYGIDMARVVDARVMLLHAYSLPITIQAGETGSWPVIDYQDMPKNIGGELDQLVEKLMEDCAAQSIPTPCPEVAYSCKEGEVLKVISGSYEEQSADLLIMGLSGAANLVNFLLGSNCLSMIEKGKVPALMVPYGAKFTGIAKIAYAATLSAGELKPLKFLCHLASWFSAEVCILHIVDMKEDLQKGIQSEGEDFLDQLRILTGYTKLSYQPVWNANTDEGLEWIAEQKDFDLISMLHTQHNLLDRIFKGSKTKRMARLTTTPFLVFPPGFLK